jgi:hypothetical protein
MKEQRGLKKMSAFRNSRFGIKGPKGGRYHEQVPMDADGAYRVGGRLDKRNITKELSDG